MKNFKAYVNLFIRKALAQPFVDETRHIPTADQNK